jgi:hypothetical protein
MELGNSAKALEFMEKVKRLDEGMRELSRKWGCTSRDSDFAPDMRDK